MAWDPEPGYYASLSARRENDWPAAWYSQVVRYGKRRKFRRREVERVWKSEEVEVVDGDLDSKANREINDRLMKEAEKLARKFNLDDPFAEGL